MANPVIVDVDGDSIIYNELSGIVQISPDASVTDSDLTDFENGTLTVAFAGGASGIDDRLTLVNTSLIQVDEGTIFDGALVIGFVSGGSDPSIPLTVTFTVDATATHVGEVVKAVSFANGSAVPVAGIRNIDFVLTDGDGGTSDTVSATVDVVAFDDGPVAISDEINTIDNAVRLGDVFADNGFGNDYDSDGPPITVTAVNGNSALVGVEFTLASGATLKVNADGTFSYDPNGQFAYLITEEKAFLTNSVYFGPFVDGFTYQVSGSSTASVTVTVFPVDGPEDELHGTAGADAPVGTADGDLFILDQGGDDFAQGGEGDDQFHFGAAFTTADRVVGDAGNDSLILRGNYSLVFGADDLDSIEEIVLASEDGDHWTANLTMLDANVAAGERLRVDATDFRTGEILSFDGAAENDGSYEVLSGAGHDLIRGGNGADLLSGGTGSDQIFGGGGGDALSGGATNDLLDGGAGADTMAGGTGHDNYIVDNVGDVVTELGQGGTDIVTSSIDYRLTTHVERLVLSGSARIDGRGNTGDNRLMGNGNNNLLNGGKGDDRIDGGGGYDRIYGGEGEDILIGGSGRDGFFFNTAPGPGNVDDILDFSVADDTINLARYAFNRLGPLGTLRADAFVLGTSSGDANDRILYDAASGDIFYDADGSGAAAALLFATVSAGTALTYADFFIYD